MFGMFQSKKNLIWLGTLDSNGCKFTAEGGIMKVSKGALVLMKGNRLGNLYVLQQFWVQRQRSHLQRSRIWIRLSYGICG